MTKHTRKLHSQESREVKVSKGAKINNRYYQVHVPYTYPAGKEHHDSITREKVKQMSQHLYALLYVRSSFAIILTRKRELVALHLLSLDVLLLYMYCSSSSRYRWVVLQFVNVEFPDHYHP